MNELRGSSFVSRGIFVLARLWQSQSARTGEVALSDPLVHAAPRDMFTSLTCSSPPSVKQEKSLATGPRPVHKKAPECLRCF